MTTKAAAKARNPPHIDVNSQVEIELKALRHRESVVGDLVRFHEDIGTTEADMQSLKTQLHNIQVQIQRVVAYAQFSSPYKPISPDPTQQLVYNNPVHRQEPHPASFPPEHL